jgi:hypothetical protein
MTRVVIAIDPAMQSGLAAWRYTPGSTHHLAGCWTVAAGQLTETQLALWVDMARRISGAEEWVAVIEGDFNPSGSKNPQPERWAYAVQQLADQRNNPSDHPTILKPKPATWRSAKHGFGWLGKVETLGRAMKGPELKAHARAHVEAYIGRDLGRVSHDATDAAAIGLWACQYALPNLGTDARWAT